jgi:hypothetical protein
MDCEVQPCGHFLKSSARRKWRRSRQGGHDEGKQLLDGNLVEIWEGVRVVIRLDQDQD